MTLGELLEKFSSKREGWCRVYHKADSQAVDLPVHRPVPKHVPLETKTARGFTANTVATLGYKCASLNQPPTNLFRAVMQSQSLNMGDGTNLNARAEMSWVGGADYSPDADPTKCSRRNWVARLAENVGIHPPEAMLNAREGLSANEVSEEHEVTLVAGESTDVSTATAALSHSHGCTQPQLHSATATAAAGWLQVSRRTCTQNLRRARSARRRYDV